MSQISGDSGVGGHACTRVWEVRAYVLTEAVQADLCFASAMALSGSCLGNDQSQVASLNHVTRKTSHKSPK